MFISKINKNYFLNAPHQKASSFGHSRKTDEDGQNRHTSGNTFVNMSDRDLYKAASILPNEKFNRIKSNIAGTLFVGVPVFDTIAQGIVKQGALASKMKASAQRAGLWGVLFGIAAATAGLKTKVNQKSVVLDNINKDHPVMRFGMDATFIMGLFLGTSALNDKAGKFIKKKYGESIEKAKAPIKKLINNTVLNRRIVAPLDKEITRIARGNRAPLALAADFVAPALVVAGYARYFAEDKSRKHNIKENYAALKGFQTALKECDLKKI